MTDHRRKRRANAMRDRAISLYKKGRHDKAVDIYLQLLEQFSDLFDSHYLQFYVGFCYAHVFEWQQALPYLERAYAELPGVHDDLWHALIPDYLAITQIHLDNYKEGLEIIQHAERYAHAYDAPDRQAQRFGHRQWMGRAHLYNQRFEEALGHFARLEDLIPTDEDRSGYEATMRFELGRAQFRLQNLRESFSQLSQINPEKLSRNDRPHYHLLMMRLCVEFKDWAKSIEHFEALARPAVPDYIAADLVYHLAGVAQYHLGDPVEARRLLEESAAVPPSEDWLRANNEAYLKALR